MGPRFDLLPQVEFYMSSCRFTCLQVHCQLFLALWTSMWVCMYRVLHWTGYGVFLPCAQCFQDRLQIHQSSDSTDLEPKTNWWINAAQLTLSCWPWPSLHPYTSGLCSQHNLWSTVNLHYLALFSPCPVPGWCRFPHSNALWHCRGTSHIKRPLNTMLWGRPPLFKLQLCVCPVHCRNKRAKSLLLKLMRYATINKINELFREE